MNLYNFLESLHNKHEMAHNPNDYLDDPTRAEITDFDHLCDELRENGFFEIEIMYYRDAMDYLRKNDPSLRDSLDLAYDMGYMTQHVNLSSEVLASLLASEDFTYRFHMYEEEINEFLNK